MDQARLDRIVGSLRGMAVGDALGAPVEFSPPGSFPPVTDFQPTAHFDLEPGQWTDDTIMALCLGDALVKAGGYDSWAVMNEYLAWYAHGKNTPKGYCFDIGVQTSGVIKQYGAGYCVVDAEERRGTSAGNGAIMRLAPAAIVAAHPAAAQEASDRLLSLSARETHYSQEAEEATVIFGRMLIAGYGGADKPAMLAAATTAPDAYGLVPLLQATDAATPVTGAGYIRLSLQAAWWAFLSTESFEACVLAAVNLGDDADTTAAIAGQLAGAYYGDSAIPQAWRDRLWETERFPRLAQALLPIEPRILRTRFAADPEFSIPAALR